MNQYFAIVTLSVFDGIADVSDIREEIFVGFVVDLNDRVLNPLFLGRVGIPLQVNDVRDTIPLQALLVPGVYLGSHEQAGLDFGRESAPRVLVVPQRDVFTVPSAVP